MWKILQTIVDSVFPPSADEILVRTCSQETVRALYQPTNRDGVTILLPYQDPTVRALIHLAKFHYHQRAYTLLAHLLSEHLRATAATEHWLLPIPLSRSRWRERGYNQVSEVAKRAVPTVPTSTLNPTLLRRIRHTTPQTSLGRTARLTNLTGAFVCTAVTPAPPALIILDDVCTTGSTLAAAKQACRETYPHVPVVCLALAG